MRTATARPRVASGQKSEGKNEMKVPRFPDQHQHQGVETSRVAYLVFCWWPKLAKKFMCRHSSWPRRVTFLMGPETQHIAPLDFIEVRWGYTWKSDKLLLMETKLVKGSCPMSHSVLAVLSWQAREMYHFNQTLKRFLQLLYLFYNKHFEPVLVCCGFFLTVR